LVEACDVRVELAEQPPRFFAGAPRMPGSLLLMVDRITGLWPNGGASGRGRIRGEKTVEPHDWFFRSHFFSDPVQPGSLGIEMMLQLLQFFAIDRELAKGMDRPYFEPLALGAPLSWKFRGQVRPENGHVITDMDIVSIEAGPEGVLVVADGSLWVDGVRCYEAKGIATRIRSGRAVADRPPTVAEAVIDPAVDKWVADHRPSYTVPVMPGMGMVDRLAAAALEYVKARYPGEKATPEWHVVDVRDVRHHSWLVCDEPRRLRAEVSLAGARAVHAVEEVDVAATMFEVTDAAAPPRRVTAGRVRVARRSSSSSSKTPFGAPPRAWPPLVGATPVASPYETGAIFWGPKLQLLRRLAIGAHGATAELDAAGADAPIGAVHPILLDGTLHAIPHDELERWCDKIPAGYMGVPVRDAARFFGPPPRRGKMRAEIRFVGFDGASAFPAFGIQIIDAQDRVWAEMRHVEVLLPMGNRNLSRDLRIPFLVQRRFREGAGLSQFHADRTELEMAEVKRTDALPGSVAHVYDLARGAAVDPRVIAIKDHVGQRARVHPGRVRVDDALSEGRCDELPLTRFPVSVETGETAVIVRDAGPPALDVARLDEAARRLEPHLGDGALAELHATLTGVRVSDPAVLLSARALVLFESDRAERMRTLLPALSAAAGGRAVRALADGASVSLEGALTEAHAVLAGDGWVAVFIDDAKGIVMKDSRNALADLAAGAGAVVLPVSTHPSNGGIEFRVGAPIPPDELRLLDRL
ncbi:MAG TPA: hypothetical protein VKU41_33295, partial [Polyangiaceae bacterium]|nr:hypothetical protein [Polyangiaceae bacterium]